MIFDNANLTSILGAIIVFAVLLISLSDKKDMDKETSKRLAGVKNKQLGSQDDNSIKLSSSDKLKLIFKDTEQKIFFIRNILDNINISQTLEKKLKLADVKMNIDVFAAIPVISIIIFSLLAFICNKIPPLNGLTSILFTIGIIGAILPTLIINIKISKRFNQFTKQFPEALDLMASSLRAGHSMMASFQMVVDESPHPISQIFKICVDDVQLGIDTKDALNHMTSYMPNSLDLRFFVTAVLIQREIGGNLAEILDSLNHTIRERFKLKGQLGSQTAQARLSGIVLALAPVLLGLGINATNPEYMKPLLVFPGYIILIIAGIMALIGFLIIRKIVDIRI